jgi:uncharacterized protein (TIGR03437 family)
MSQRECTSVRVAQVTAASLAHGRAERVFPRDGGAATDAASSRRKRIRKVSPGGTITTYAGTGVAGFTGDGGPATSAKLSDPQGLAVDSANNLFVVDRNNLRIRKINGTPAIVSSAVVNGASFGPAGPGIVPGEIATVFGANLTNASGINLASALPLATNLVGVQVLVNGTAAPIFAVDNVNGQQQVNFQVPWEIAGLTTATVQVVNNGAAGNSVSVLVVAAQPGMFTYTLGSTTYGAILHANNQLANSANPAVGGETVLIFCTGLGDVSPRPASGAAAGASMTVNTATVTVGGMAANVDYAGLAPGFVGLFQINADVPIGLPPGNQPVIITINGAKSVIALLPNK